MGSFSVSRGSVSVSSGSFSNSLGAFSISVGSFSNSVGSFSTSFSSFAFFEGSVSVSGPAASILATFRASSLHAAARPSSFFLLATRAAFRGVTSRLSCVSFTTFACGCASGSGSGSAAFLRPSVRADRRITFTFTFVFTFSFTSDDNSDSTCSACFLFSAASCLFSATDSASPFSVIFIGSTPRNTWDSACRYPLRTFSSSCIKNGTPSWRLRSSRWCDSAALAVHKSVSSSTSCPLRNPASLFRRSAMLISPGRRRSSQMRSESSFRC
mmetsp:Transcript_8652/g.14893  ORF Transcript_8652/g.14893 Transcript_8652/m.14893 type:complete len:270 (-) Transcript_8652:920-1729(-)